jgi:hypothetical protein
LIAEIPSTSGSTRRPRSAAASPAAWAAPRAAARAWDGSRSADLTPAAAGAEGDYVVGQWKGGGTQTGDAFDDIPVGSLPAGTGRRMEFTGMTVLKVKDGLIKEEIGLDDAVTALKQLALIPRD